MGCPPSPALRKTQENYLLAGHLVSIGLVGSAAISIAAQ
jgi:hypothetical protein